MKNKNIILYTIMLGFISLNIYLLKWISYPTHFFFFFIWDRVLLSHYRPRLDLNLQAFCHQNTPFWDYRKAKPGLVYYPRMHKTFHQNEQRYCCANSLHNESIISIFYKLLHSIFEDKCIERIFKWCLNNLSQVN